MLAIKKFINLIYTITIIGNDKIECRNLANLNFDFFYIFCVIKYTFEGMYVN